MTVQRFVIISGLLGVFVGLAPGQDPTDFRHDIRVDKGFQPSHTYSLADIESLDMASGNLGLRIPLAQQFRGPGGHSWGVGLYYNSKNFETYAQNFNDHPLQRSSAGGWRLGFRYSVEPVLTSTFAGDPCGQNNFRKVRVVEPDGKQHVLYNANGADCADGSLVWSGTSPIVTTQQETWFSTDGSFLRLVIPNGNNWPENGWTLYMPNGTQVWGGTFQQIVDNNGNRAQVFTYFNGTNFQDEITLYCQTPTGPTAAASINIEHITANPVRDVVTMTGPSGNVLTWSVYWTTASILSSAGGYYSRENPQNFQSFGSDLPVVDRIELPNGLQYKFYYASRYKEVSGIDLPTGAHVDYAYRLDSDFATKAWYRVLENAPTQKTITYLNEHDCYPNCTSNQPSETWKYVFGQAGLAGSGQTTVCVQGLPNPCVAGAGATTYYYTPVDYRFNILGAGEITKVQNADGSLKETAFAQNIPVLPNGSQISLDLSVNSWPKGEYVTEGAGTAAKTSFVIRAEDKNGTTTSEKHFDWAESTIARDGAIPPGKVAVRTVTSAYQTSTSDAGATTYSSTAYSAPGNVALLRLKTSEEVAGAAVVSRAEWTYSAAGNVSRERRWDSQNGAYTAPLTATNAIEVSYAYDSYGNRTSVTDPNGTTTYTYGLTPGCNLGGGNYTSLWVTEITRGVGVQAQTWKYAYNPCHDQPKQITDPNNNVSASYTFDSFGRPIIVSEGNGGRATVYGYYDGARRVEVRKDKEAYGDGLLRTVFHFDQLGRPRLKRTLESSTDNIGDETKGIKVQTRYGRCATDLSRSCSFESNSYTSSTSNNSASTMGWTETVLDQRGRREWVKAYVGGALPPNWPGGTNASVNGTSQTQYEMTASGFRVTTTDPASVKRRTYGDGLGRMVQVDEDPGGTSSATTYYLYDAADNLTSVCQNGVFNGTSCQGGLGRTFNYSSASRLTSATNPESGTISYTYDGNGNVKTRADQRPVTITMSYDVHNRLKSKMYSNDASATVTYCYDGDTAGGCAGAPMDGSGNLKGRLTMVTNNVAQNRYYCYDALGRVLRSGQKIDSRDYDFGSACNSGYGYKPFLGLVSMTYPSGRKVTTSYDDAGRTSNVSGLAGAQTAPYATPSYAGNYMTGLMFGSGLAHTLSYNSRQQRTSMVLKRPVNSTTMVTVGQWDADYGASNNNGNVQSQSVVFPGVGTYTQSYAYDGMNRLKSAAESLNGGAAQWSQFYCLDAYGNRWLCNGSYVPYPGRTPVSQSFTNNRWTVSGAGADGAGNMTALPEAGGASSYVFDGENRVSVATIPNVGTTTYFYDGEGRRVKRVMPTGEVNLFVYDAMGQMAAEYSTGQVTANLGMHYYTTDVLGSVRMVTDATGNTKRRTDYLPYGEEIFALYRNNSLEYSGPVYPTVSQDFERQKFTGKERDAETGLDYFGARYMSSAQGRFTSPDEFTGGPFEVGGSRPEKPGPLPYADITNPQSLNKYTYALNNPLRYIDPDGHEPDEKKLTSEEESIFKAAVGCLFGPIGCILNPLINPPGVGENSKPPTLREAFTDEGKGAALAVIIPGVGRAAGGTARELFSSIGGDKALTKLAQEAGSSVQSGIDSLTKQLGAGNLNPGIGTKNLFGNISYARARDGARVFFRQVGDRIEILAKASKANEDKVIKRLEDLYKDK